MEGTAYAALVSVFHVINRIQNPYCPIPFQDKSQIQSLSDKVSSLIDFLEKNDTQKRRKSTEGLERRIFDVANAAEESIESFVVQQILAKSRRGSHFSKYVPNTIRNLDFIKKRVVKNEEVMKTIHERTYASFCEDLDKTINELDCITEEMMKAEEGEFKENQLPISSTFLVDPSMAPSGKYAMVGFDEDLLCLMNMLRSNQSSRQIIPVVGMGGSGKTTLALNAFNHPAIVPCFDVRGWVTVSQDYNKREILLCLLCNITKVNEKSQMETEEVGEKLHKYLIGRKYLIILDDIWSSGAWDEIKRYFPGNDDNGSRVIVTTRISSVANDIGSCSPYQMKFLDEVKSWELLSCIVFSSQEACPSELEELGKEIVRNCKGLPLAIVVISGLLKVSQKTREFWANVAENITSIINTENDESCLKVLALSYNYLPIHLKPCFLYMSTFKEDSIIRTSTLIKLWVAEGFLKPSTKTLEEVAFKYLNNLVDRNLLMVGKRGFGGEIKHITIHDLLRDFCLRESLKRGFAQKRRFNANARSLLSFASGCLLHIFDRNQRMKLMNSRYLEIKNVPRYQSQVYISSSISLLWNLETIIVHLSRDILTLPSEIWNISHLRHILIRPEVHLPDPKIGGNNPCILNSLQTLSVISNFSFSDEALSMIPNLKKLKLVFSETSFQELLSLKRPFKNLLRCHQLETLRCEFKETRYSMETLISFPPTLRSLTLVNSHIPWENMSLIGSLPNLEVLKLEDQAFCGEEWNPIEGEFECLKCLSIYWCSLITWNTESSHFPKLQHLNLAWVRGLKEIPIGIGEIASLESIVLKGTDSKSFVMSAKKLHKERQEMQGNDDLLIQVFVWPKKEELQEMITDKFQIGWFS